MLDPETPPEAEGGVEGGVDVAHRIAQGNPPGALETGMSERCHHRSMVVPHGRDHVAAPKIPSASVVMTPPGGCVAR